MSVDIFINSLTAFGACASAFAAIRIFMLQRAERLETKRDEYLAHEAPRRPDLDCAEHAKCVITFEIFNKSQRKALICDVRAFSNQGNLINITWSDRVDKFGNPSPSRQMLGIDDMVTIYLRRDDGEAFSWARIEVENSWQTLAFDFDIVAQRSSNDW